MYEKGTHRDYQKSWLPLEAAISAVYWTHQIDKAMFFFGGLCAYSAVPGNGCLANMWNRKTT
jgi:hypothetical protein